MPGYRGLVNSFPSNSTQLRNPKPKADEKNHTSQRTCPQTYHLCRQNAPNWEAVLHSLWQQASRCHSMCSHLAQTHNCRQWLIRNGSNYWPAYYFCKKVERFILSGGMLSTLIQREAEKRKRCSQKRNIHSNSRESTKKKKKKRISHRGCQIKTGLPLPPFRRVMWGEVGASLNKNPERHWYQSNPFLWSTFSFPTKNSELGPTEAVSGVRYFLWNKQHCSASANRAWLPEGSSI